MTDNGYADWSLGEIVDQMIRLRLRKEETGETDRVEYKDLVRELDRRGEVLTRMAPSSGATE